ncbi:MAG: tRNA (N6-isopentenyl adenosine(37)-C2)-methylthiotransferase MiaB [Erysipelotrichaceae bacterium]|uniref:tRNA (N6-isopentenyl adenosine(37)-C2)-methylthiotransferase MiaB n=1 Tax=Floccifex sp. TaxID=2815810 RepID=UPI002A74BF4C|nr:tRNA (N6-isopentenyl adenosine(37)-C2)-methylthiotransferase MiaB [Floccifex sp.]MDD7280528.1 tRNA (N6-isopentenyl adenosine(37)-C2)-methylthiotransferase MiaB [Erysipelotrichaceae bacterium]MDY2957925.1 tRNA (N6-isopentenyl adenosine(37)-C2)-methylthiotransferase MiaB [Floccifex sp.]
MKQKPGWVLPNLKEAQKRTKEETPRIDTYIIPENARSMGIGHTYFISTYGCQANERDSETLAGIMDTLGFEKVEDVEQADVILINTCAIRENAMEKVLGEIGNFKRLYRANPDLVIGVCGCMAQEEGFVERLLEKYPQVRLLFGTHNIQDLPSMLYSVMYEKQRVVRIYSREGEVYENLPVHRFGKHKAWVNIMYGCDKFCTYCIVPYTRGKQRSRYMDEILNEVKELKEQGYKEITLLGQNVNAYGKDIDDSYDFATLLEEVAKIGIPRIRFTTSHPWDFSDEMLDVIGKYDNIMPFIHLPLQSGDSDILKLMGRRYSQEEYIALYNKIIERIPHVAVSTDIIVGFPNESDEQFQHTLDVVNYCRFDNAFTFIYSPRPGTPAAKMEDSIDMETKKKRLALLNKTWNEHALERNKAYVGRTVTVLVDGFSKKNDLVYSGYTETNKLVNFTGNNIKTGDFVQVYIDGAKTFSLDGHAIQE